MAGRPLAGLWGAGGRLSVSATAGVVVGAKWPRQTAQSASNSRFYMVVEIVDADFKPGDDSVQVGLYGERLEDFPVIPNLGDLVVVTNVSAKLFRGKRQLQGNLRRSRVWPISAAALAHDQWPPATRQYATIINDILAARAQLLADPAFSLENSFSFNIATIRAGSCSGRIDIVAAVVRFEPVAQDTRDGGDLYVRDDSDSEPIKVVLCTKAVAGLSSLGVLSRDVPPDLVSCSASNVVVKFRDVRVDFGTNKGDSHIIFDPDWSSAIVVHGPDLPLLPCLRKIVEAQSSSNAGSGDLAMATDTTDTAAEQQPPSSTESAEQDRVAKAVPGPPSPNPASPARVVAVAVRHATAPKPPLVQLRDVLSAVRGEEPPEDQSSFAVRVRITATTLTSAQDALDAPLAVFRLDDHTGSVEAVMERRELSSIFNKRGASSRAALSHADRTLLLLLAAGNWTEVVLAFDTETDQLFMSGLALVNPDETERAGEDGPLCR